MIIRKTVNADSTGITQAVEITGKFLKECGVKDKELNRSVLAVEEAVGNLCAHAEEDGRIDIRIRSFLGRITVELTSKGERFDPTENMTAASILDEEVGEAAQEMISGIILKSVAEDLKYRYTHGANRISFTILKSPRQFLYRTLGAMAAAVIVGFVLSALGFEQFNHMADSYVFIPIRTMYMNALKMVVAPVVFFSIISCIVQFSDISELGRVGGRIILIYLTTTVLAVAVGIGSFSLFKPGNKLPPDADVWESSAAELASKTMDVSIKDMIVSIVPDDFVEPFVVSNMLELIFLAVVCGIAAGLIGRYSETVKDIFEAFNALFLKITTMIIHFMPVAVFCSICSMMMDTGIKTVISILGIFGTFLFGLVCMIIVYSLILAFVGKINPLPFIKSYFPSMVQVFSMASSNASIPINMEACDRLGIPKKIYSLSIPLGATINMDGTCVHLAVFSLALARMYGVEITRASIMAIVITIIVLSIGAPGIPGAGLICLSVLLTQIGVPAEAIGLVMGIDSLIGMFRCMSNCTGDVAASVLVAKLEGSLDKDKYNAPV
ncbi:MAG: cation:dicarboxylase symporter family transporter [Lachnospiraceae bacterium]|nr:cation:dicarboxylase symporter family transporter [Lachnospiraceae bacterium]